MGMALWDRGSRERLDAGGAGFEDVSSCWRGSHRHDYQPGNCRTWLGIWCLLLGACNIVLCSYIEIVEQQACSDTEFRLTCPSLEAHVAIIQAVFTPSNVSITRADLPSVNATASTLNVSNYTCDDVFFLFSYPHTSAYKHNVSRRLMAVNKSEEMNLRAPTSHRCSGVNHCSFILNLDHEESRTWSAGFVYIKYACMDESRVTKYCNQEVQVGEGFVQSPGYPHYYVEHGACRWLLRAPRGQRVRLALLDLSLRSIGPFEDDCVDRLIVQDSTTGRSLFSSCDQVDAPLEMESEGETLDVLVRTNSKRMYPKRGILFHYKPLGCVTPPAPRDGYLVYRSVAHAHFMCCVGHAFPDTRQRERTLRCLSDNTWDGRLPDCRSN